MKQLLLLTFIAVASEALAQEDAQCVRERAAMVDTIRAYARSEAGVLGPQGISERVLKAMGQTQRHRFVPGGSCSAAYEDAPVQNGGAAPSHKPSKEKDPTVANTKPASPNAMVNMVNMLVQQGVFTQDQADGLIKQAEDDDRGQGTQRIPLRQADGEQHDGQDNDPG